MEAHKMSVSQFGIIKSRCLQVGEHLALNSLQQAAFRSGRLNRTGQRSLLLVNLELQINIIPYLVELVLL